MNVIRHNIARLRTLIARLRLIGVSAPRALFLEIPRYLVGRAYRRLGDVLYALLDRARLLDRRVRRSLESVSRGDGVCFYVIVVPAVLHFLAPSVCLLKGRVRLVFVLNGVSGVERAALAARFPEIPMIALGAVPGTLWPHGRVLSLLLRASERDFGICDHDFYMFDERFADRLAFDDGELAICATGFHNARTGARFPGTHFLYVRVEHAREIMARYRVGAQLYKRIPRRAAPALREMGLSPKHPPKAYQSFFDSFLMIAALGIHDGLRIRQLHLDDGDWEHVGGTSIGAAITKDPLHHYVAHRFHVLLRDLGGFEGYSAGAVLPPRRAEMIRKGLDAQVLARIDRLIARLGARCGPRR